MRVLEEEERVELLPDVTIEGTGVPVVECALDEELLRDGVAEGEIKPAMLEKVDVDVRHEEANCIVKICIITRSLVKHVQVPGLIAKVPLVPVVPCIPLISICKTSTRIIYIRRYPR